MARGTRTPRLTVSGARQPTELFRRVAYPGRELPLDRYEALRDR